VVIDDRTLLVPAVSTADDAAHVRDAIEAHFSDALLPPTVVERSDPGQRADEVGIAAAVISLEDGHPGLARHRARTRAQYAVACWCLSSPPADQNDGFALWPTVADWLPQPYVHHQIAVKPHESTTARFDRARPDEGWFEYAPYLLPSEETVLRAPWTAMAAAPASHCARALLGAAWELYVCACMPSPLQRPDRAIHLLAAINALCVPPPPPPRIAGTVDERWNQVAARLDVWTDLERDGHDVTAARRTRDRLDAIRNLLLHAADSFNLSYGIAPASSRGRHVSKGELLPAVVASDLGLMLLAVEDATRKMYEQARGNGWDPAEFERHFK
jgi:hypothetical protein